MEGDVTSSLQAGSLQVFPSLRTASLPLLTPLQPSCCHPQFCSSQHRHHTAQSPSAFPRVQAVRCLQPSQATLIPDLLPPPNTGIAFQRLSVSTLPTTDQSYLREAHGSSHLCITERQQTAPHLTLLTTQVYSLILSVGRGLASIIISSMQ